ADALRAEQKSLGKQIGKASADERESLLAHAKELAAEVKAAEAEQSEASEEVSALHAGIPNLVHPEAPSGGEQDYVVLQHVGQPREFDFTPREIGRASCRERV